MSSKAQKVLIRCDASSEIGFGHVVRCLALADELRDSRGFRVEFAMLQGPRGVSQIQAQGYLVYHPTEGAQIPDEGQWLQTLITEHQHKVLILDIRTELATEAVKSIRKSGVLIVSIDDPSDRRLHADLAFYPPVPQAERMDWNGFTGQRYVGWDWVLLRPQFTNTARHAREAESIARSRNCNDKVKILVTMGGSDPAGFTLKAIDAIEQIDEDFFVMVVLGGGFMHDSALVKLVNRYDKAVKVYRDIADIAPLMAESDLAITSFGVTAYELASIGVPSLYLCPTRDHVESASALVAQGCGISLDCSHGLAPKHLSAAIMRLSRDTIKYRGHEKFKVPELDGFACSRIAARILNRVALPL